MTRPTEIRHPSFTKLSINKMRFNYNPRRLRMRILNNQEWRRRNKVRPKPNIRPRTQILPEPSSPLTDSNIPTRDNNLPKETIQHLKGIKNPFVKAMEIRRNPIIPGMKRRNGTTRTMTTYSTPIPQQSIPPRLSKPLTPNTLENIRNRLETPTKE